MKIVFALLLAVQALTASASECKDTKAEWWCKAVKAQIKEQGVDMCDSSDYRQWVDGTCKKFCGLCAPWSACDAHIAGADNTMCIYPAGVYGSNCGSTSDVETGPISAKLQQDIVDRHNKWRQKVASGDVSGLPAGNIPDLKWDDGLAVVAQRWADQCPEFPHPHDVNRATKQFPNGAGQNYYSGWTEGMAVSNELTKKDIDAAVDGWYDEYQNFVYYKCPIDKFSDKCVEGKKSVEKNYPGEAMIGHFTQVIWGKTSYVGCGWIKYKHGEEDTTTVICNYGPAGNVLGQPIYEEYE